MAMQSILLLAALATPNAPQQGPGEVAPDSTEARAARIEVRGPNGEWVRLGDPLQCGAWVLPLTSLSDQVMRAHPEPERVAETDLRMFEVAISAPLGLDLAVTPTVSAFVHHADDAVFLVNGALRTFGPLSAPRSVEGDSSADVGVLARRDGCGYPLTRGPIRVVPQPNQDLLLFAVGRGSKAHVVVNGIEHTFDAGPTTPLVIESDGSPIDVAGSADLDAALFADESYALPYYGQFSVARLIEAESSGAAGSYRALVKGSGISPSPTRARQALARAGVGPDLLPGSITVDPGSTSSIPAGHVRWFDFHHFPTDGHPVTKFAVAMGSAEGRIGFQRHLGETLEATTLMVEVRSQIRNFPSSTQRSGLEESADSKPSPSVAALSDVTDEVGLGLYLHLEGPPEQLDIRPTMGPGAAWGDVNGDGYLDLFVPQGGGREGVAPLPDRLYLGAEGGSFTDASAASGLASGDAGMGALFVDVSGDGHLDLYCANYGLDRLFLGKGDGTFTDATELLPGHDLWSASVTAADPDGDGDLDLYITSYLDYDPAKMPPADELGRYQREDPVEMLPFAFPGQRNVYLRNQLAETGGLGFEDVTEELGLLDVQGRGMQTVFWDFDRDGDEDLYVANDVSFNVLFRNEGDGTFKDVSFSTGLDDPRGGMGLAVGDIDLDGDDDVFLTNWQLEANALYLNSIVSSTHVKRRRSSFHDGTVKSGFGPSGIGKTSWGAEFFDLELDGDLDLYVANGYTSPDYESTGICVGQTDQLFLGNGRGKLSEASDLAPAAMSLAYASRGAIGADYDRDGDVDLLVTANNGPVTLLRNDAKRAGTWLGVRLRQPGGNRHGIGARVTVVTEGSRPRSQSLRAGTGYLTGNAPELHFGLGAIDGPVLVQVTWPDGTTTEHPGVTPGEWVTLAR